MIFKSESLTTYLPLALFGAMAGLALPPLGWWPVLFVSFPILHASLFSNDISRRVLFFRTLSFAFGYFLVAFHWIGFAFTVDATTYLWMMPFAVGGLSLFMALYWAVAVFLISFVPLKIIPVFARLPLAIGIAEYLRGHLLTGFPWSAVGLIAEEMGGFAQLASVVGMTGLSFILLGFAVLPVLVFQNGHFNFRAVTRVISVLALLPLGWWWGELRVQNNPTQLQNIVVVRLVQPNIAQSDKWRQDNAAAIFETLLELTIRPSSSDVQPSIVVWPESAVPFLLAENDDALQRIAQTLGPQRVLLTGAIRRDLGGVGEPPYFTSILMIDGMGSVRATYDKWRLVPGGEFLPFEALLSRLGFRKVVNLPESFTAGQGPQAFDILNAGRAALLICYEAIFPHHLLPAQKPDWIVNVTNDGWFGASVGPHQHIAQVRLRAIEQGLPIARSANTGISAMIDPVGRYVASASLDEKTVVDIALPKALAHKTFYNQWGDFGLLIVIAGLIFGFRLFQLDLRQRDSR